jgi:RimJ/RimL family protein N-acetyltransferase
MIEKYLFKSERLGFRTWADNDLESMAAINSDPEVMKFFPNTQAKEHTKNFIERMSSQFKKRGYCYFAVEILKTKEFIGFIGLSRQTYEADFTPCIDIGWRLKKDTWGKGFATEGAARCLEFAFSQLKLNQIFSIASIINEPSINVMKKIGMSKVKDFEFSLLLNNEKLKKCVLYSIEGIN